MTIPTNKTFNPGLKKIIITKIIKGLNKTRKKERNSVKKEMKRTTPTMSTEDVNNTDADVNKCSGAVTEPAGPTEQKYLGRIAPSPSGHLHSK